MSDNIVQVNQIVRRVEVTTPGPAGRDGSSAAVSKIIAGSNVTISPTSGLGDVTINSTSSSSGTVTSVTGGTALTVTGDANVTPTVNHDAFGTAASYAFPSSITTNATGHITAAVPGTQPMLPANNLSEVDAASARSNLGVPATNHSHSAGNIISGVLDVARIPDLAASKINSGVLDAARIPTLSTGDISGLGTAAVEDAGTGANEIVQLDGSSRLPAVDGSQLTNLPAATSIPASGLTSGSLSIDLIPNADGTLDLGSADFRWAEIHGDLEGSVMFRAKNGNASALSVGDVVYISGYTSGTTPDVDLADANDAAKMPSFGVISTGGNSGAEVYITTLGTLEGIDLPSGTYSAGDELFVSTTAGDFTNTAPTGESAAIQKIGFVLKANTGGGTNGSIKVLGAGRSNATPNLDSGKIFYGNGSNQAVSTTLTSVAEAAGSIATHNAITTAHGISAFGASLVDDANAAAARTTLGAAGTNHTHTLANITDSGTAAALDVGIGSNDVLQVSTSGVTANEFLRLEAIGTKVISRTAAEVLSDIGAQAALTAPVTSPAMTGVSAGSITGVIKCSQSQYDAITPDANTLYVIV
jgi:hypothetical protein